MTTFSEQKDMVREAVQGITTRFTRSYWLACAREGRFTQELWQALGDLGLLGLGVPEADGGSGGGISEVVTLMEELALAGIPPLYLIVTGLARVPILKYGTPAQIKRYVTPTTTGEHKICFALTEPHAGTNTFKIETRAERATDGWILSGQKVWISGANEADTMLVVARTQAFEDVSDRREGLSLFLIDGKAPGIEMQRLHVDITAPEKQFQVFFNEIHLGADALLGEEGQGFTYLFDGLNPERLLVAAMAVGIGDYALARTVAYANQRAPFGKPIGSYQALQHPLAHAKAHLEAARLMLYHAAASFDAGEKAGAESNMAKLLASEAAIAACDSAIQVHGGNGFDADYDIITLWPLARFLAVAPVTNEMMLNYIGERVLGLPKSY